MVGLYLAGEKVLIGAEEIIDAGNWAVHDLNKFNQRYGGDKGSNNVQELLTITRKALIQLLNK